MWVPHQPTAEVSLPRCHEIGLYKITHQLLPTLKKSLQQKNVLNVNVQAQHWGAIMGRVWWEALNASFMSQPYQPSLHSAPPARQEVCQRLSIGECVCTCASHQEGSARR